MKTPQRFLPSRAQYISFGFIGSFLAAFTTLYLIETIWGEMPRVVHPVVIGIVCGIISIYAHHHFDKKIAALTEKLRKGGTLPAKEAASDADIIRLVKDNMPEEAALLYNSLHKGTIEKAKLAVGLDISKEQYNPILWIAFLSAVFNVFMGIRLGKPPLIILGVLFAIGGCVTVFYQRRIRKTAEANRALIESGSLPTTERRA